jgi:predicted glycoside hydrolase/deacetylase ChbG (UPF0249 family)
MMRSLIITADDYGMHCSVNKAINEGIEAGLITSTNVMTGMPECNDAVKLREKFPQVSIGLHWTLTAGKPVSSPDSITSLVADNGEFHSYTVFRDRYRKGLISDSEIKAELTAQYKKFLDLCGEPDYWNTHQNVHVSFRLMQLFLELAKELKIKKMRSHQRIYVPSSNKAKLPITRRIIEPAKRIVINHWMKNAQKSGIAFPDGLIFPINPEKDREDIEYLINNIKWKNATCAELHIHPALQADCRYFGSITEQRVTEYELYTNRHTLDIIKSANLNLINFSVLNNNF